MASSSITSWQIDGEKVEAVTDFIFLGSKISVHCKCSNEIKKLAPCKDFPGGSDGKESACNARYLLLGKKAMKNLDIILKKQRHHFAAKDPYSQSYSFSSSHALIWELEHKEGWVLKNWCFQTVVLEKTLENPLHSKEIILVNSKGNQLWIFIGRTDAEAPKLWPPDAKSGLTGKDLDAGKAWRKKKEVAGDEMVDGITESIDMNLSKLWEIVKDRGA